MCSAQRFAAADRDAGVAMDHIPALDGLRGLAVAGVLLFHGGHLVGGYLGVDLFFILSGFLITSLLLAESRTSGAVGLRGFWARRARRLLPALCGVLVGVALYCLVFADAAELVRIRGDALATIGYGANWRAVFAHQDYWTLFSAPSPLEHTWSLAIEEQFYLLWPLIFVGLLAWWKRLVPAAVLVASLVLACVSSALMFLMYTPTNVSRVYYGTDTRVTGILLGAALAAWLAMRGPVAGRVARMAVELTAVVGVAILAVAWTRLQGQSPTLYRGGLVVCGLAVVAVLAAAAHPQLGPIARALSFQPLRALGLISYGVYLWHWPVDVVLTEKRTGRGGWWLFALQTVATLVVAVLSYRLLEQPVRRGALSARQWRVLSPSVAVGLVLVLVVATQGASKHPVAATPRVAISTAVFEARPAQQQTERVMIVGDSVASTLGEAFNEIRTDPPILTLDLGVSGCNFPSDVNLVRYPRSEVPAGYGVVELGRFRALRGSPCSASWRDAVERFRPDIVLWVYAGAGHGQAQFGGQWVGACDSASQTNFDRGLRQAITTLGARGAKVVLTTAAYNRGVYTSRDREVDCDNAVRRSVAVSTGTPLIDLCSRICPDRACHENEGGATLRPDGRHYEGAGARIVAQWLVEQIHSMGTVSGSVAPRGKHAV